MSKKQIGVSKTRPKSEARPLGTPRKRKAINGEKKRVILASRRRSAIASLPNADIETVAIVDNTMYALHGVSDVVESRYTNPVAITQPILQEQKTMNLTLVKHSTNGKRAIYSGAAVSLAIAVAAFPNKTAPTLIQVADGTFATKVVKTPKVKLTKAERAALPKPTLAERVARAQKRVDALNAKLRSEVPAMM